MIGIAGSSSIASRTSSTWCSSRPLKQLMPTMNGRPRSSKKSTAAKQSANRRVSTRTTAPIAPRTRSSHMNQKRCWPGVPNRYRIRSSSSDSRPKSMATVVVRLSGVAARSSTPTLASVITASVVSGTISDTEPTKVVLPTPNPPATTIFADVVAAVPGCRLKTSEATQNPFQERDIRKLPVASHGLVHDHQPHTGHVPHQDPRHPERQREQRGHLSDRPGLHAQPGDRSVFGLEQGSRSEERR